MRQFDLIENPSERSREHAPYFVILQSHYLTPLDSVVVAPVVRDSMRAVSSLDLSVEHDGENLILSIGELFSIERTMLRVVAGSMAHIEHEIRRALDRVFTGF